MKGRPSNVRGLGRQRHVPREKLGDYLREFKAVLHKHGYESALYGHFGDGLVHCRINFDLETESQGA